jgi:hypothetical protein
MYDTYEVAGVLVDIVFGNRPPKLSNIIFARSKPSMQEDLRSIKRNCTTKENSEQIRTPYAPPERKQAI